MKITKNTKIILLVTVLSLVFGTIIGFNVSAEADAAVTVDSANVAYNEMMHLAINLECNETLAEGDALGLIVWDASVEGEFTVENATYVTYEEKVDKGGMKYFTSQGIAAPEISDVYRIAGCIKSADGSVRVGTILEYSIVEYLNDRIATEGITDAQRDLYVKTLAYGKAAGAIFNKD